MYACIYMRACFRLLARATGLRACECMFFFSTLLYVSVYIYTQSKRQIKVEIEYSAGLLANSIYVA